MNENQYLDGTSLYGDHMSEPEINIWFQAEQLGYHDLVSSGEDEYSGTGWSAVYDRHIFSRLPVRRFRHCLALGCSDGSEILPIAHRIDTITAIEPAESWWRSEIGGVRTEYRKPTVMGDIDCPDESIDLVIAFGVLHHIPNVSHVVGELARITAKGGILAIREPIFSMGDWTKPRKGLTANERGLPLPWFRELLNDLSLKITHEALCSFPPVARVAENLGVKKPYACNAYVMLDAIFSSIFSFNYCYHRTSVWKKFAPTSVCLIAEK
jgi:SAM-dependent methyltransferase